MRMLHEHRTLTTTHIAELAFGAVRTAQTRMLQLAGLGVVERFRPYLPAGSSPMYYVLAPTGASVLAAESNISATRLGYKREQALAIAHSLQLEHLTGVNDFFTSLVAYARRSDKELSLDIWWPERRFARLYGDIVRPDGYGRWTASKHSTDFFLELDCETESVPAVAKKIPRYAHLARSSGLVTPVLIWVPTHQREAAIRNFLYPNVRRYETVPIATAAADLLDPASEHPHPAGHIWRPLTETNTTTDRVALNELTGVWPHTAAPRAGATTVPHDGNGFASPRPMPPADPNPKPFRRLRHRACTAESIVDGLPL